MTEAQIRVLYVEDSPRTPELVNLLAETRPDIDLETAASKSEALSTLEAGPYDCVVSSRTLPDASGIKLLGVIDDRYPEVPTILHVDSVSEDLIRRAIEAGVVTTVPRDPAEGTDLLAKSIDRVVTGSLDRSQRETLDLINAVIRDLNRELVRASTRAEIDRRVCEIISQSKPYVFAWIGEPDPESANILIRASSGVEEGYLEEITITTGNDPRGKGPTGAAIRSQESQFMQNIPEDPAYEPWRAEALERGYRSSAAIPIKFGGQLYAVLNVYADRTEAFGPAERSLLEGLGNTIANAYHDIQSNEVARKFQRAVEQAGDAIFITDIDGTIEYVNPEFEALTGYDETEAVGATPKILDSGAHPSAYFDAMWETILAGEIWEGEIVNETRSGDRYDADQTIAPIERPDGTIEGFVTIQHDVTARNERTRELERYEHLWRNLPVGIGRVGPEPERRVKLANDRLVEIAGAMSTAELEGVPIATLWPDTSERTSFFATVLEEELATTRAKLQALTGSPRWVRITALASDTADGQVVDVVMQDITDLREKETYLEKAQEVANVGWWQKDIPSDEILWSDQIWDMWGVEPTSERIDHETFLSYVHPADRETVDEQWEVAKRGQPYDIEHRIITGDGALRWMREKAEISFDESGQPVSAIGIVQDITAQKRREQALQTRTEQYEAVVENVHDGLVIIQDEVIVFANSRISELTGYPVSAIVGESFAEFVVAEDRERIIERYRNRMAGGEPLRTYQIDLRCKDGDRIPVEVAVGTFEYDGEPATITAMRDITDRVDRTRQLQVMDRVLRHNLRNDMTTIQGFAETAKTKVDGVDHELETIIDTAKQFMRTVDKEREIVQVIAEQPEIVDTDVVETCKTVIEEIEQKHPTADIEFDGPEAVTARATTKLARAIEELVENAIVHTDSEPVEVTLDVSANPESVRIEVRDTGPGIPEAEVNVLTREYDVEPLYHGSGLGLSLVNWIIKQSQGTLGFEANEPRGSVVVIELQRSP